MTDQQSNQIELPENLKRQIVVFERRLRFMETVVAALGGLSGLLATYALVFLSDRLWDTPSALRSALTLLGAAAFLAFAWFWMRHWLWHRRNTRDLARLVQRAYRKLGDRLLGAVELADGTHSLAENVSPSLCRAAIRQVAAEAEKYDFKAAVPVRRSRLVAILFTVLAITVGLGVVLFPQAGWNALMRWFNPMGAVERFTFVRLESMPDALRVPHGEPFEIVTMLDEGSLWTPESATGRVDDQPRIQARVVRGRARFMIPGQTRQGELTIRIGDVSRRMTIIPMYRPEMVQMHAEIELPAYLALEPRTALVRGGRAEVLRGSRVVLTGEVERALSSAIWERNGDRVALPVDASRFTTPPILAEALSTDRFLWVDLHEMKGAAPYDLTLGVVDDEAPQVIGEGIPRAVAVLENEVLRLNVRARDDFGVKQVWVEWVTENAEERGYVKQERREVVSEGAPDAAALSGTYLFSPALAGIPQETLILLRAAATDYLPGREPTYSSPFQIYVLSRAAHAELLRAEMQKIQERIADIAWEEERLMTANLELFQQPDEELDTDATKQALEENQRAEERNREQAKRAAERLLELAREALRNQDIGMETVQEWLELAQALAALAEQEMREAAQALGDAAQSPQERRDELEEAIRKEQAALEKLQEMMEQVDRSLVNIAARNFINRLRQVAEWKEELAQALQELLPHIIGMRVEDLAPEHELVLSRLVTRQKENRRQAGFIQDDLGGFFRLTDEAVYGVIHDEMDERLMKDRLAMLADRIAVNESTGAVEESLIWEQEFNDWADMLEAAAGGDGEGEGEGESGEVDIELLLALIRTRIQQENVREQTRVIEEEQEHNERYEADARQLALRQYAIAEILDPFMGTITDPQIAELAAQVNHLVLYAGELIESLQTDAETTAIQTMVIELISQAMQRASGQSQGQAQAVMVALGQQPGTQPGTQPGGSYAGGHAGPREVLHGRAAETAGASRAVDRAGGVSTASMPAEYRDMLEAYFENVEGHR